MSTKLLTVAWNTLVDRHSILRTVFVESSRRGHIYDQVVFKAIIPQITVIRAKSSDPMSKLQSSEWTVEDDLIPQHHLTISQKDQSTVFCRFDINHALFDASSLSILMGEFASAYSRKQLPPVANYRLYIEHIQEVDPSKSAGFWRKYLAGLEPTILRSPEVLPTGNSTSSTIDILLQTPASSIQAFCKAYQTTIFDIFKISWALVLRTFTANNDISFGYLTSGRDTPIPLGDQIMGPLINVLVCRTKFSTNSKLIDLLRTAQSDYIDSLDHQYCSLSDIYSYADLDGHTMFNTVLSLQRKTAGDEQSNEVSIEIVGGYDPAEVCNVGEMSDYTGLMS